MCYIRIFFDLGGFLKLEGPSLIQGSFSKDPATQASTYKVPLPVWNPKPSTLKLKIELENTKL